MGAFTNQDRASVAPDDVRLMCKDITDERRFAKLNEWEQNFIASVENTAANQNRISEKQFTILSRIYEKATEAG